MFLGAKHMGDSILSDVQNRVTGTGVTQTWGYTINDKNTEKIFFSILDVYPPKFGCMKLLVQPPESSHQCASFGTLFAIKGFQK